MQFQVPQFIEIEDKIFGPLTLKQFIYLAGSAGVVFILYAFLPLFLTIIFAIPVVVLGVALAFYKINDRPFINLVQSMVGYVLGSRLYIWKKETKPTKAARGGAEGVPKPIINLPKLSESKLKDLAWSLDIKETQNKQF